MQADCRVIIFTGANYWKVEKAPENLNGDFGIVMRYKWIKSRKQFANKAVPFSCPKHYQKLTKDEAKAQGLI